MRCFGFILVLVLFAGFRPACRHPFFVSMTEIEWKPKDKKLEIAVRIFTDDLEKGMAAFCNCRTDLGNPAKSEQMEKLLQSYLAEHLQITLGGKAVKINFLGREKEEESTWSYLEADIPAFSGKLVIQNTILHSVQEKQVNLIRFRKPGFDETIQLRYPENRHEFP